MIDHCERLNKIMAAKNARVISRRFMCFVFVYTNIHQNKYTFQILTKHFLYIFIYNTLYFYLSTNCVKIYL